MYTTLNNAKLNTLVNTALKEKPLAQAITTLMPVKGEFLSNDAMLKAVKNIANKTTLQSAKANIKVEASGDTQTKTIEGVKVEGYDSLTSKQKANLVNELKTYKDKITKSIKNGNFDKFIEKAFGRKVDNPQELAALKKAALNGEWDKVIPKIKIGTQADFSTAKNANGQSVNAMGAFIKGSGEGGATGTIILNKALLDGPVKVNGKAMTFQNILTEEVGHAWDARLNKTDSKGDEGEALSLLFTSVDKTGIALKQTMNAVETALKENDHGTMTITDKNGNQKTIEVEFGFFSKLKRAFKKGIKKIGRAFKKVGSAIVDGVKKVGKAIVKGVKKLAQSKIFAVVLQVAQFIPVLAPFAAVARGAMAAYNVVKGIKDGNLMQAISGVAGGALGGVGKALGATASTMTNVASYAGKVAGIARTYNAVKNGDITGALMHGAAAANGAGLIDQNSMSNIQNIAKITNVVQTGDITRGVQLGLQYANGSDWAQENQSGINKINSAFNLYGSITNGSDADRINAAASFGQQMGVLNEQTTDNIHFATDVVSAVKQRDVNGLTHTLLKNNVIDGRTAFNMNSAGSMYTAVRNRDVNALTHALTQNGIIDRNTADNVVSLSNYYKHGSNIQQMIRTKNFDLEAANDAYQFLKTGTDNRAVLNNDQVIQNSSVYNRVGATPGITPNMAIPGFAPIPSNSFAGDDVNTNQSDQTYKTAHEEKGWWDRFTEWWGTPTSYGRTVEDSRKGTEMFIQQAHEAYAKGQITESQRDGYIAFAKESYRAVARVPFKTNGEVTGTVGSVVGGGVLSRASRGAKSSNRAGGVKPPRSQEWFDEVARKATRNPESDKLVLGHFSRDGSTYQKVAAHYKATYFKVEDWNKVTKGLSPNEVWKINKAFLEQQIRQGKQILLSHDPSKVRPRSFYEKELNRLRDLGYNFKQVNQWTWEAVK